MALVIRSSPETIEIFWHSCEMRMHWLQITTGFPSSKMFGCWARFKSRPSGHIPTMSARNVIEHHGKLEPVGYSPDNGRMIQPAEGLL